MKRILMMALFAASLLNNTVSAHEYTAGDLLIDHPYTRTTPPMAPVGGGFLEITNNGSEADKLIGGTIGIAEALEIHEMVMDDGIMKMRQLEDGLDIPAGETVSLKPGGYHLMFIKLSEQMKEDDRHKATLHFEKAGEIAVEFVVKDINKMLDEADNKVMDHSAHAETDEKTD